MYAVEKKKSIDDITNVEYLVYRYGKDIDKESLWFCFFPSEEFEVVSDKISETWVSKTIFDGKNEYITTSFPEYFENEFFVRAGDWDLDIRDYPVLEKYKHQYEDVYKKIINQL